MATSAGQRYAFRPAITRDPGRGGVREHDQERFLRHCGTPQVVAKNADLRVGLLRGRMDAELVAQGSINQAHLNELASAMTLWGKHLDSFHANVHVEVIGSKEEVGQACYLATVPA